MKPVCSSRRSHSLSLVLLTTARKMIGIVRVRVVTIAMENATMSPFFIVGPHASRPTIYRAFHNVLSDYKHL
jgi:hypothetical protein